MSIRFKVTAVLAGATLIAVLLFVGLIARDAQAQDARTVTRTINDRPYEWTLPDASCRLLRGWEDNSAQAWCSTGLMSYDPDGSKDRAPDTWYSVSSTR